MKYIRNFLVKYSHIWVFLYGLIYFPWFTYLEKNVTNNFHIIHMAIDDSIPFVEYFVVPYFLWFGYVAAAVAYFFFKNKHDFYRLCGFLAAGMTIFLVVSTIYPGSCMALCYRYTDESLSEHSCLQLLRCPYCRDEE